MIHPQIFYTATCDNCFKSWNDDSGIVAMKEHSSMRDTLFDSDWLICQYEHGEKHIGKHYCPSCFSFNDNDEIELKDTF